jgi:BolA protein
MTLRERIHTALLGLEPGHLEVQDESHRHARGQETHYKATIVSDRFAGLPLLRRHQAVHAILGDLMAQFHALALHTYTPAEWQERRAAPQSPACRGGSTHDRH